MSSPWQHLNSVRCARPTGGCWTRAHPPGSGAALVALLVLPAAVSDANRVQLSNVLQSDNASSPIALLAHVSPRGIAVVTVVKGEGALAENDLNTNSTARQASSLRGATVLFDEQVRMFAGQQHGRGLEENTFSHAQCALCIGCSTGRLYVVTCTTVFQTPNHANSAALEPSCAVHNQSNHTTVEPESHKRTCSGQNFRSMRTNQLEFRLDVAIIPQVLVPKLPLPSLATVLDGDVLKACRGMSSSSVLYGNSSGSILIALEPVRRTFAAGADEPTSAATVTMAESNLNVKRTSLPVTFPTCAIGSWSGTCLVGDVHGGIHIFASGARTHTLMLPSCIVGLTWLQADETDSESSCRKFSAFSDRGDILQSSSSKSNQEQRFGAANESRYSHGLLLGHDAILSLAITADGDAVRIADDGTQRHIFDDDRMIIGMVAWKRQTDSFCALWDASGYLHVVTMSLLSKPSKIGQTTTQSNLVQESLRNLRSLGRIAHNALDRVRNEHKAVQGLSDLWTLAASPGFGWKGDVRVTNDGVASSHSPVFVTFNQRPRTVSVFPDQNLRTVSTEQSHEPLTSVRIMLTLEQTRYTTQQLKSWHAIIVIKSNSYDQRVVAFPFEISNELIRFDVSAVDLPVGCFPLEVSISCCPRYVVDYEGLVGCLGISVARTTIEICDVLGAEIAAEPSSVEELGANRNRASFSFLSPNVNAQELSSSLGILLQQCDMRKMEIIMPGRGLGVSSLKIAPLSASRRLLSGFVPRHLLPAIHYALLLICPVESVPGSDRRGNTALQELWKTRLTDLQDQLRGLMDNECTMATPLLQPSVVRNLFRVCQGIVEIYFDMRSAPVTAY